MERDSWSSAAPPGGGGGGVGMQQRATACDSGGRTTARPPGVHPRATWWAGCGRSARTGDYADRGHGRETAFALSGRDWARTARCATWLSASDARLIARHMRSRRAGAAVMREVIGLPHLGLPSGPRYSADRCRAVMRWARSVTGKAAGINACLDGLVRIGYCRGRADGRS